VSQLYVVKVVCGGRWASGRGRRSTQEPHTKMWGKIASCFTLLTQITRLKVVNSEIKSEDQSSYLERYSPKGPCHLDESSMSHTLAQKQSSYTGQEGVNERPRNSVKAPIAIASVFSKLKLM